MALVLRNTRRVNRALAKALQGLWRAWTARQMASLEVGLQLMDACWWRKRELAEERAEALRAASARRYGEKI